MSMGHSFHYGMAHWAFASYPFMLSERRASGWPSTNGWPLQTLLPSSSLPSLSGHYPLTIPQITYRLLPVYIYMRVYILLNMPNTWSMISFETTLTAIKILLLLAIYSSKYISFLRSIRVSPKKSFFSSNNISYLVKRYEPIIFYFLIFVKQNLRSQLSIRSFF